MTRCPDHRRWPGMDLGHCDACAHETATTDHAKGAAAVRAALAAAPAPPTDPDPDDTRARALARARHERTTR